MKQAINHLHNVVAPVAGSRSHAHRVASAWCRVRSFGFAYMATKHQRLREPSP